MTTFNPEHDDAYTVADELNTVEADIVGSATQSRVRVVTGTGNLQASDVGGTVLVTGSSSFTLTIPAVLPQGKINVLNGSSGKVTIAATSPATVEGTALGAGLILDAKAAGSLTSSAANVWHLAAGAAS